MKNGCGQNIISAGRAKSSYDCLHAKPYVFKIAQQMARVRPKFVTRRVQPAGMNNFEREFNCNCKICCRPSFYNAASFKSTAIDPWMMQRSFFPLATYFPPRWISRALSLIFFCGILEICHNFCERAALPLSTYYGVRTTQCYAPPADRRALGPRGRHGPGFSGLGLAEPEFKKPSPAQPMGWPKWAEI